jgi:hypothetical protein
MALQCSTHGLWAWGGRASAKANARCQVAGDSRLLPAAARSQPGRRAWGRSSGAGQWSEAAAGADSMEDAWGRAC